MTREWAFDEAAAPGVDHSQENAVSAYETASAQLADPVDEATGSWSSSPSSRTER